MKHSIGRSLVLACVLATCFSCSEEQPPAYYMRFLHDGVEVRYDDPAALSAAFTLSVGQYTGVFTGFNSTSTMVLKVYDNQAISEKVYREFTPVGPVFTGSLMTYQSGGNTYTQGALVPDIRIRVTELRDDYVRGVFAGTLKADVQPDVVISQGEFFVRRIE
jgi:hypothetical protein